MTNRYEQQFLTELAHRLSTRFSARSVVALELSNWAEEQDLGFSWDPDFDSFKRKGVPAEIWSDLRGRLARQAEKARPVQPDALACNISALASELCLNLGDARHQAAWFLVSAVTSTPSLNLIPSMTFGNWFLPLRRNHFFDAA